MTRMIEIFRLHCRCWPTTLAALAIGAALILQTGSASAADPQISKETAKLGTELASTVEREQKLREDLELSTKTEIELRKAFNQEVRSVADRGVLASLVSDVSAALCKPFVGAVRWMEDDPDFKCRDHEKLSDQLDEQQRRSSTLQRELAEVSNRRQAIEKELHPKLPSSTPVVFSSGESAIVVKDGKVHPAGTPAASGAR